MQEQKLKGKKIYIFGVQGLVAKELWQACSKYIDFGKWYQGHRKRKTRS